MKKCDLVLLTVSIIFFCFGYYFSFSVIETSTKVIRLEDIFALLLVPCLFFSLNYTADIYVGKIIYFFIFISIYGYATTYINYVNESINYIGFIYLIKELEYFLVGFMFYVFIINVKNFRLPITIIFLFILSNFIWAIYQLQSGESLGWYGVTTIGVEKAAAASGAVYLSGFLFSFSCYILEAQREIFKNISLIVAILSFVGMLLVSSRTPIISGLIFLVLYFLMSAYYSFINSKLRFSAKSFIYFLIVALSLVYLYHPFSEYLITVGERMSDFDYGKSDRFEKIMTSINFSNSEMYEFLIGKGKGINESLSSTGDLGIDSQFARYLIELGIVGGISWLLFFIYTLYFSFKLIKYKSKAALLSISFTLSFLSMFYSYDVMIISKYAYIYWIGLFLFVGYIKRSCLLEERSKNMMTYYAK